MKSQQAFRAMNTLMVQGTTSDAGKSVLVAALCRILWRHGYAVAPFKPQNMALNSAVTKEGGEIGRAQAVQAQACGLDPSVDMNPILLKPNSDIGAQVIVLGKAVGNLKAQDYHGEKPNLLNDVLAAHGRLSNQYQAVVVEGAGSPAEINLRDNDIANMGFAEAADCPVIIVADIDRGGVFAHLVGTYELLSESEKQRVKGFVINRFRGDIALLEPGLDWLTEKTGVPVLGVIPYLMDLHIEAEDAINLNQQTDAQAEVLNVVVPIYPRASNHTDFDTLRLHPNVNCQLVRKPSDVSQCDLIVLPGSKNVRGDLDWLTQEGWLPFIQRHLRYGGKVAGICGGYQMLGNTIHDPEGIEMAPGSSDALGLLDFETWLAPEKQLVNVAGVGCQNGFLNGLPVKGYEIHAGRSEGPALNNSLFTLTAQEGPQASSYADGALSHDNQILGTYVHGVFDEPQLLAEILKWAGANQTEHVFDYEALKEAEFDRLANAVEDAIGLENIIKLVGLS